MDTATAQKSPIHLSHVVGRKSPIHLTLGELEPMNRYPDTRSPWSQVSNLSDDRLGLSVFGVDCRGLVASTITDFAERQFNIEATAVNSLIDIHNACYVLSIESDQRDTVEAAFHKTTERLASDDLEPLSDEPTLRYELIVVADNTPGVLAFLAGLTKKNQINITSLVGGTALGRKRNEAKNTEEVGRFKVHMKLDIPSDGAILRLARVKSELVQLKHDRGWDYVLAEGSLSPEAFFRRATELKS